MIYHKPPKNFNPRFEIVSCYVEFEGQILLLHRHKGKSQGGRWGVPAGKINKGETEFQAMVREIKEETGLEIIPNQLEYLSKVYVKYPKYHFGYHMFRIELERRPEVILSESEHQAYKWAFPKDALDLNLVEDLYECIKLYYR